MSKGNSNSLPVIAIVFLALKMPFKRRKDLIRLSLPFISAAFILSLASYHIKDPAWGLVFYCLGLYVAVPFAVSVHRICLLPEKLLDQEEVIQWSARETDYGLALTVIVVSILFSVMMVYTVFDLNEDGRAHLRNMDAHGIFLNHVVFLPASYVWARTALAFPRVSLDEGVDLKWAWEKSKPYSIELFLLLGLLPILAEMVVSFFEAFSPAGVLLSIVSGLAWVFVGLFEVCVLSLVYAYIIGKEGG